MAALTFAVGKIAGKTLSQSVVAEVFAYGCGELAFAMDTAILSIMASPWTAPVAVAGMVGTVYAVGHWGMHKW